MKVGTMRNQSLKLIIGNSNSSELEDSKISEVFKLRWKEDRQINNFQTLEELKEAKIGWKGVIIAFHVSEDEILGAEFAEEWEEVVHMEGVYFKVKDGQVAVVDGGLTRDKD